MKNKITNKTLIIILIALAIISGTAVFCASFFAKTGDVVVIHKGGEVIEKIDLSKLKEPRTIDLGTNTAYVEEDGVSMKSAKCPDKICVNTGKISNDTQAIICAPNKIMIEFKGKDRKVDAVSGGR